MKKIWVLIFCIILSLSDSIAIVARNSENEIYGTLRVEFSDTLGETELIPIMIKNDDIYVEAKSLADRLGYKTENINDESIAIYNIENEELPYKFVQFFKGTTKVKNLLYTNILDCYETPVPCIFNEAGSWIPLQYFLIILNSGMLLVDDTVIINLPEKKIIDLYIDIMRKIDIYTFDWGKDFGYTDLDVKLIGASSHVVNQFNGILSFDGYSWVQLFQSFALESSSYDSKYGEDMAMLLCTESNGELKKAKEDIDKLLDIFSEDGKLGKTLSVYSDSLDEDVGTLYETCNSILEDIQKDNFNIESYNRTYNALEKALDKQTWFSDTGGVILDAQREFSKSMSNALSLLDIAEKVAEVVQYGQEFTNQDKFSVVALEDFLKEAEKGEESTSTVIWSMQNYLKTLTSNLINYSANRFFWENIDQWIGDAIKGGKALGAEANMILLAWSFASDYIPFLSNGINASDKFELALYSSLIQSKAFFIYQNYRNSIFGEEADITANNLYTSAKYCYIFLKSCYITREAALGSLEGKHDEIKKQLEPLIEQQNDINDDIAGMLIVLKRAKESNEGLIYGFLPQDNVDYIKKYKEGKTKTYSTLVSQGALVLEETNIVQDDAERESTNGTIEYEKEGGKELFQGSKAKKVELGENYGLVLFENGVVASFGSKFGALGRKDEDEELTYVMDNVKDISASNDYAVAVDNDNNAWIWGDLEYENGGELIGLEQKKYTTPVIFEQGVSSISLSKNGVSGTIVKTDGTLWMWSGIETMTNEGEHGPYKLQQILEDVKTAKAGLDIMLAVKNDGSIWIWGYNWRWWSAGREGFRHFYEEPILYFDEGVVKQIEAEQDCFGFILDDNKLYITNSEGAFVKRGVGSSFSPQAVFSDVSYVNIGSNTGCLIDMEGNLYTWGDNTYGALASRYEDRTLSEARPVLEDVISASLTDQFGTAVTEDGKVWIWGSNGTFKDQLGGIDRDICIEPEILYSPD